jgi:indole-3-glycerol phosphate synthase
LADTIPAIIERIVIAKKRELRRQEEAEPLRSLQERVMGQARSEGNGGRPSLRQRLLEGLPGVSQERRVQVIAEVKRASPSRGVLAEADACRRLPLVYAENGAAAVSVLTETDHFHGDLGDLTDARNELERFFGSDRPALLRKDFLFEPYQVWESRAGDADAVLLIVAILSDRRLRELLALAQELEMDCLVECHDEREVERALAAGADIIGINNRDLRTFEVDLSTTERLRPLIPAGVVVVSESGIRARADVERLAGLGVDAALVGEALVTAADPGAKLRELLV